MQVAGLHCRRRAGCSPTSRASRASPASNAGDPDQCRRPDKATRPGAHTLASGVAKAYAQVAAGSPPLRRVYSKLPWPHLYELPQSVASVIVERDWPHDGDSGERRCSSAG